MSFARFWRAFASARSQFLKHVRYTMLLQFFSRTGAQTRLPVEGRMEVFVRHCSFSKASAHKERFPGFSREACYRNLLETVDRSQANLTFLLDTALGAYEEHFLARHAEDAVVPFKAGTEAGAFLFLLDYIAALRLAPSTLIYIVEDDYLHRAGWTAVLREAFSLPIDYATLYDHRDKYFDPAYRKLFSKIYAAESCHWRTTPSTTNTFAVRAGTLAEDAAIQRRYSQQGPITKDHHKFCHLGRRGRVLVSSLPGWSTHAEPRYASPCTDWGCEFPCQERF